MTKSQHWRAFSTIIAPEGPPMLDVDRLVGTVPLAPNLSRERGVLASCPLPTAPARNYCDHKAMPHE